MLVLTRKIGQSLIIGDDVEVTIVEIRGEQVRLSIKAPLEIPIHRKEVYELIQQENQEAALLPSEVRLENIMELWQGKNSQEDEKDRK